MRNFHKRHAISAPFSCKRVSSFHPVLQLWLSLLPSCLLNVRNFWQNPVAQGIFLGSLTEASWTEMICSRMCGPPIHIHAPFFWPRPCFRSEPANCSSCWYYCLKLVIRSTQFRPMAAALIFCTNSSPFPSTTPNSKFRLDGVAVLCEFSTKPRHSVRHHIKQFCWEVQLPECVLWSGNWGPASLVRNLCGILSIGRVYSQPGHHSGQHKLNLCGDQQFRAGVCEEQDEIWVLVQVPVWANTRYRQCISCSAGRRGSCTRSYKFADMAIAND